MTVTMREVAQASGVSLMTVSNVINGRPGAVGTETRLRVLEAVDRLGYEVNLTARRLRKGLTGTIGLIVPRFDHPYFGELAARLSSALATTGRHLSVEQSGASAEGELAFDTRTWIDSRPPFRSFSWESKECRRASITCNSTTKPERTWRPPISSSVERGIS
jgi:transcriptional regulator with XRE-family HTH domain